LIEYAVLLRLPPAVERSLPDGTMGRKARRSRVPLLVAVASVPLALMWQTPVRGSELGGDCCADLEDRVADLEAAAVQKGKKNVSVTVYGKVNRAVLFWDDGHEKGTYVVDNYYAASRFGFKGSAKISGDCSAGYQLEIESRKAASDRVSQFNDNNAGDDLNVRPIQHVPRRYGVSCAGV
jgi:hypothetical protein